MTALAGNQLMTTMIGGEVGELPPGKYWAPEIPPLPDALSVIVAEGERWEEAALARASA